MPFSPAIPPLPPRPPSAYTAPALPAPGSTPLTLLRVSGSAPERDAPRMLDFGDGVVVPAMTRGIYRQRFTISGAWTVLAISSTGDTVGLWRRVPQELGPAALHAAEAELWAELDRLDPPVRLQKEA